jgi:hypothetical protein
VRLADRSAEVIDQCTTPWRVGGSTIPTSVCCEFQLSMLSCRRNSSKPIHFHPSHGPSTTLNKTVSPFM